MTQGEPEIELLLGTVNDVTVLAPMEMYQVSNKIWQKCFEVSVMISKMPWREIKRSMCSYWTLFATKMQIKKCHVSGATKVIVRCFLLF